MLSKSLFIGGLDRTGKTYLRFILESHPEFVFSKRTSLWPKYYQKYGPLEIGENLENLLRTLTRNKHIMALSPDFKSLKNDFERGPHTYERLFELIHEQYAEKNGRNFWGDQTEFLEKYALIILNAYPHAKFVHLIRDPRDRFAAILKKSTNRQGLGIATARWINSATLAKKNQAEYPQRYLIIRYETLVSNPEKTVKHICDFLGLNFLPSMLKLDQIPRFKDQNPGADKLSSPITDRYVGQFINELSQSQIVFIEKFSRKFMHEFQYQIYTSQNASRQSFAEFLKVWPINMLKMFSWNLITQEGRV